MSISYMRMYMTKPRTAYNVSTTTTHRVKYIYTAQYAAIQKNDFLA